MTERQSSIVFAHQGGKGHMSSGLESSQVSTIQTSPVVCMSLPATTIMARSKHAKICSVWSPRGKQEGLELGRL